MKSFQEIKDELGLERFTWSEFGTMYFKSSSIPEEKRVVRHLDQALTVELLPVYTNLYHAIEKWIEDHLVISMYAVLPSIEVGPDYIIRPFYSYYVSLRNYLYDQEEEGYIEPPDLYEEMLEEIGDLLHQPMEGKDQVIQRILRKSLLEPTGKTIYDSKRAMFIIIEPKVSLEDLEEWKQLCEQE